MKPKGNSFQSERSLYIQISSSGLCCSSWGLFLIFFRHPEERDIHSQYFTAVMYLLFVLFIFDENFHEYIEKKISWVNHFPSEFLNSWPLTMIIPNIVLMFVGRFWILWTTSLLLQRIHYLEDQKSVTAEKGRAERICTSFEQWKFVLQGHKAGAARQLHSSLINQKQLMRLTVSFKGSRDAFFFSLLSVDLEILIWLIQI